MADPRTTTDISLVKTLPTIAKELGMNRSTLVRLEQRGVIDMAPVVGKPIQGRVYDKKLEAKVKAQIAAYLTKKNLANANRPNAPKTFIIVE